VLLLLLESSVSVSVSQSLLIEWPSTIKKPPLLERLALAQGSPGTETTDSRPLTLFAYFLHSTPALCSDSHARESLESRNSHVLAGVVFLTVFFRVAVYVSLLLLLFLLLYYYYVIIIFLFPPPLSLL